MKRTVAGFAVLLALLLVNAMSYATAQAEQKGTTAPAKVTTVTFWTFLNPTDNAPRNNVQTTLIKEFESENPNTKVDVQVLPWADIAPKLIQAVAADKAPDVSRVAIDTAETLIAAKALMVLDKYTDQLSAAEKEDWLLPWSRGLHGGHKMTFQLEHRADMLWYRKDHLAEIGAGVPRTWDEVGETGGKLTAKGHMGFAVGLSFAGNGNSFTEWFRPAIWGAGGDFTDQDGKAAYNSPAGQRTMQALYDLVYKYKAIPAEVLSVDVDAVFQGIQASRVSMATWFTHRLVTARQSQGVGDNLQVAPIPSFSADKPSPCFIGGWTIAMPAKAKNPDQGWKLLQYLTSAKAGIVGAKIAGEMPPRNSSYRDPWFSENPLGKEMMIWKAYLGEHGKMPSFRSDELFLARTQVEAAQRIVMNKEPIKPVLDEAAKKYNEKR